MKKIPVIAALGFTTTGCVDSDKTEEGTIEPAAEPSLEPAAEPSGELESSIEAIVGNWAAMSMSYSYDGYGELYEYPYVYSEEEISYGVSVSYQSYSQLFLSIAEDNSYFIQLYEYSMMLSIAEEELYNASYGESYGYAVDVSVSENGDYLIDFEGEVLVCELTGEELSCLIDGTEVMWERFEGEIPERTEEEEISVTLEPPVFEDNGACYDLDLGTEEGEALAWGALSDVEDDFVPECGENGVDVAFLWTAPAAGCYQFTTAGSFAYLSLELRSACDEEIFDCGSQAIIREMSADESAVVLIDGLPQGEQSEFPLFNLSILPYEGASLSGSPTDLGAALGEVVSLRALEGTVEIQTNCGDLSFGEAFMWTAPATGTVNIDTFGSDFDTILSVSSGSCSAGSCNDDALEAVEDEYLNALVTLEVEEGSSYEIAVGGLSGSQGNYILNINYED